MSISFKDDMGPEMPDIIKEMFNVPAIDRRTALLEKIETAFIQKQMENIAKSAKQPATLEINKIGDRKKVGGRVYELDEKGWKRLPIGTTF